MPGIDQNIMAAPDVPVEMAALSTAARRISRNSACHILRVVASAQ